MEYEHLDDDGRRGIADYWLGQTENQREQKAQEVDVYTILLESADDDEKSAYSKLRDASQKDLDRLTRQCEAWRKVRDGIPKIAVKKEKGAKAG